MATYTNANASGSGQASLGFSFPTVALVKVTALGLQVSSPPNADSDQHLNVGWIAFGATLNPFGDGNEVYWFDPIWVNFTRTHWPVIPTRVAGAFSDFAADQIRWHFSPGVTAKIFANGS